VAGERILVVDDGADMRDFVINYVIKPNDYQYFEARDGLEAFDIIVQEAPDMILLDLQMPRLDGIGLLKRMQEEGIRIPVVLMTFYGSEEIAIEVFRLGVRDYVIKPFTDDELLDAIEKALTETRLRKERDSLQERLINVNQLQQRQLQDQQILLRIGKTITQLPDEESLLRQIVEVAAAITRNERAELLILSDVDAGELVLRADRTEDGISIGSETVVNATAEKAISQKRAVVGEPQYLPGQDRLSVQICTPLKWGKEVVGVLTATSTTDTISDHQLSLLDALADYASIGLEHLSLAAAAR